MQRLLLRFLVTLAILVVPLPPKAQPPANVPRIGWLALGAPSGNPYLLDAFRRGLRELGWTEGQNLRIDIRWSAGNPEVARSYAAQLLELMPDVILATSSANLTVIQQATRTVPVVFLQVSDPVAQGFVPNLTRPGGNLTWPE